VTRPAPVSFFNRFRTRSTHRRVLTQRSDHVLAPHRPARLREDHQQLIDENRFRP